MTVLPQVDLHHVSLSGKEPPADRSVEGACPAGRGCCMMHGIHGPTRVMSCDMRDMLVLTIATQVLIRGRADIEERVEDGVTPLIVARYTD